jgi:hypothetical protein
MKETVSSEQRIQAFYDIFANPVERLGATRMAAPGRMEGL